MIKKCICITLILLIGCSGKINKEAADQFVESLHAAYNNGDFTSIEDFYSDEFYKSSPKEQWIPKLKKWKNEFGEIKTSNQKSWNASSFFSISKEYRGVYYYLVYDVQYEKVQAIEEFKIFQAQESGSIKILAHSIKIVEWKYLNDSFIKNVFLTRGHKNTNDDCVIA